MQAKLVSLGSLLLVAAALMLVGAVSAQEHSADEPPHWEYEGEAGPAHWGDLDESYAACSSGHAQSPIDVVTAGEVNLQPITFNYQPSALAIFNNGHTIQDAYGEGSYITYNEIRYDLLQFHFHHPSEHTVNGEVFDMEIHFVHRSVAGNLAVVGVLLNAGDLDNAMYAPIFEHLPAEVSEPEADDSVVINALDLLPESKLYYTYTGSLTTPPCSEGVRWLLLTQPVTLSEAQISAFSDIFALDARPVQPLNNRDLLVDSAA